MKFAAWLVNGANAMAAAAVAAVAAARRLSGVKAKASHMIGGGVDGLVRVALHVARAASCRALNGTPLRTYGGQEANSAATAE